VTLIVPGREPLPRRQYLLDAAGRPVKQIDRMAASRCFVMRLDADGQPDPATRVELPVTGDVTTVSDVECVQAGPPPSCQPLTMTFVSPELWLLAP
jgi:hypothetical protein